MIDTVIFDVGNVLTHFAWQEFIRSFGYSEDICKRIGSATVGSPYWKEYDRGVMSDDEIVSSFVSCDPGVEKEIREVMHDLHGIVTPADYAKEWIGALKSKGLRVLYLSNFSLKAFNECRDALDFIPYTDGGIFSYSVRLIKPDPAIYRCLIEKYDLSPEHCVFIDDLEENIEAAASLGFQTILFDDYGSVAERLDNMISMK